MTKCLSCYDRASPFGNKYGRHCHLTPARKLYLNAEVNVEVPCSSPASIHFLNIYILLRPDEFRQNQPAYACADALDFYSYRHRNSALYQSYEIRYSNKLVIKI